MTIPLKFGSNKQEVPDEKILNQFQIGSYVQLNSDVEAILIHRLHHWIKFLILSCLAGETIYIILKGIHLVTIPQISVPIEAIFQNENVFLMNLPKGPISK